MARKNLATAAAAGSFGTISLAALATLGACGGGGATTLAGPSDDASGGSSASLPDGAPGVSDAAAVDGASPSSGGRGDGGSGNRPDATSGDGGGPSTCSGGDGGLPLNCAKTPSACCYPDDTNTGVPPGTTLTPSGSLRVDTEGAVISGLDVAGTIDVMANNVVIKNTRVTVSSSGSYAVAIRGGVTGAVIEDTTIRGQDNDLNSVEYAVFVITKSPVSVSRVDLYNCGQCVMGGNVTVRDSYIHDAANPPGAHIESIYGLSGASYIHNTMFNSYQQTAAVYLDPNLGGTLDCQCSVIDNLLAGGGYTVYGGGKDATNVVIKNNRFAKLYYPKAGYWGTDAYYAPNGAGNEWSGNFWDDTGQAVTP